MSADRHSQPAGASEGVLEEGGRELNRIIAGGGSTDAAEQALIEGLNRELALLDAEERVAWAVRHFRENLILSTSFGIQAAVMLDILRRHGPEIPVVFIDTGYLFPETYQYAEQLTALLKLNLKTYTPILTPARQEALYGKLWDKGLEGLQRYALINKVEPMDRALRELGAKMWMTGLRRMQASSRSGFSILMRQNQVIKFSPVIDWDDALVETYLELHGLPRHPLASQGYVSVGDWHSTSKLEPGMLPEQTRFQGIKRECGLHEPSKVPGFKL